jgi:hypothetical protein
MYREERTEHSGENMPFPASNTAVYLEVSSLTSHKAQTPPVLYVLYEVVNKKNHPCL